MALSISDIKSKSGARIVRRTLETFADPESGEEGEVLLRVLPIGKWRELGDSEKALPPLDNDASEEDILAHQMRGPASLIAACLTDEEKTVIGLEEALVLCMDPKGLDGMQIKELVQAIHDVNGLESGND